MTDIQNPRAFLPELTALRGVFALWVFAYHTNLHLHFAAFRGPIGCGYLGVDGFFILSGLVLGHRYPHLPWRAAGLARFWWRRFVRLYPTVLAMLAVLGAMYGVARLMGVHPHEALRASGREFLLQIFLLNGLGFSQGWTWNYPSWSISTEWVGYLLFPVMAAVSARLPGRAVVLLLFGCAGLLFWLAGIGPSGLNLSYKGALPRFLPEFLAGLLLARLLLLGCIPAVRVLIPLAIALFAAGIALRWRSSMGDALVVLALWLLLWGMAGARRRSLTRIPGLFALGSLSYTFYMAYAPVEVLFARGTAHLGTAPSTAPYPWLAVLFLADLALAWLTTRFIERPALHHLAGRRADG